MASGWGARGATCSDFCRAFGFAAFHRLMPALFQGDAPITGKSVHRFPGRTKDLAGEQVDQADGHRLITPQLR